MKINSEINKTRIKLMPLISLLIVYWFFSQKPSFFRVGVRRQSQSERLRARGFSFFSSYSTEMNFWICEHKER